MLILFFIAPLATTYVFLNFQKLQVKKQVKREILAGMDKNQLVLLKFTKEEIKNRFIWKHSKEFEYKGEMYDVIETETYGDTTCYWLWSDNKETFLNKQLDQLVAIALGNNPKNKENQKRLHVFLKSLFFSDNENIITTYFNESKNNFHFIPVFYQSFSISPPLPPPKKV